MVVSAISRTDHKSSFDFYQERLVVSTEYPGTRRYSLNHSPEYEYNLCNNATKLVITVSPSIYHFWHEAVGAALDQIKKNSALELVIDCPPDFDKELPHYKFFVALLNYFNIKYTEIDISKGCVINNFYLYNPDHVVVSGWSAAVYDSVVKYSKLKNVPYRKAYLKRGGAIFDTRLSDEDLLIDYLETRGFEIIVPEEIGTYQDQINFFNQTKVLVATTGSGLANSLFMPPGGVVIEIATPLPLPVGLERSEDADYDWVDTLQYYYDLISFEKEHLHIRIPNHSKTSSDIIKFLNEIGAIDV